MSNRRPRRRSIDRRMPPPHVLAAARQAACPDCASDVELSSADGVWHVAIAHDPGCPQLTWRERHGALHSLAIIAQPGTTVDPQLVADVVKELAADPHTRAVRVATTAATTWTERQIIDRPEEP